jgi:hypothetical protein
MQNVISLTRQTLLHLVHKVHSLFRKKEGSVPQEVREALLQCQNMEQLLDLLFSTDFNKDEAFLKLFEKRIDEIDPPF